MQTGCATSFQVEREGMHDSLYGPVQTGCCHDWFFRCLPPPTNVLGELSTDDVGNYDCCTKQIRKCGTLITLNNYTVAIIIVAYTDQMFCRPFATTRLIIASLESLGDLKPDMRIS